VGGPDDARHDALTHDPTFRMRRLFAVLLSSGTLGLVACPPAAGRPAAAPSPTGHPVDSAAFGPLDGPDSLVILPATGVRPRLPMERPYFGAPGSRNQSIVVAVVVDTSGLVVPGTLAVLRASDPRMVRPACEALARQRFIVARPDGRPHRELTVSSWALHDSTDPSPILDPRQVLAALRAMPPADLIRYLGTKPGCP
jgi:hypothetical protein